VVIAAITSCTNTSNPSVMLAAGLLAKKAVERGLKRQAVGEDQPGARLEGGDRLSTAKPACCRTSSAQLHLVGFGCTTCIGNSGPLPEAVAKRCRRRTWWWRRCSAATAISKAASIRR
jgi:aconitate hydratase